MKEASAHHQRTSGRRIVATLLASVAGALLTIAIWSAATGDLAPWWASNIVGFVFGLAVLFWPRRHQ